MCTSINIDFHGIRITLDISNSISNYFLETVQVNKPHRHFGAKKEQGKQS
jgi:hypothetical protein